MSDGVAPSKGAWTPGPWETMNLNQAGFDTIIQTIADRNGLYEICRIRKHPQRADEIRSNALLISKSPQMAELLREIYEKSAMPESTFDKLQSLLTELEASC